MTTMRDGMNTLFAVGYGAWPAARRVAGLIGALKGAGVSVLVDIRHSPCSSTAAPGSLYGPKPWNLQVEGGIRAALEAEGIGYTWLVELGNPQKNDPEMRVLRSHLTDDSGGWPVHRGLVRLAELVRANPRGCCVLCACAKYKECHRRVVAEALSARHFEGALRIEDLSEGEAGAPSDARGSLRLKCPILVIPEMLVVYQQF